MTTAVNATLAGQRPLFTLTPLGALVGSLGAGRINLFIPVGGMYIGQVATRCAMHETLASGGLTQVMARKFHYARDSISSLKVCYSNFYGSEVPINTSASVTASIEYPEGTFTQVLFGGLTSGTIAAGGLLFSDDVSVSIPNGAKFYTRVFQTCSSGFPYSARTGGTVGGDVIAFAASGLADKTMSDPLPANAAQYFIYGPVAIVATTTRPTIAAIGDSRQFGQRDIASTPLGDVGEVTRSISADYGYMNLGVSGETGSLFTGPAAEKRRTLMAYCSHIVCEYGLNDIFGANTATEVYTTLQTIRSKQSQPFYQLTLPTQTTSTDDWATLDNQTPVAGEIRCLELNTLIRGNSAGFTGIFDIEGVVNSLNSGGNRAWDATFTNDGVHELPAGNEAIAASGIINPSVFMP